MRGFKSVFSIILAVVFLSSIHSYADTFVSFHTGSNTD